jgi:D-serine deaminase-like pyridoxal phosphate-dependent protein
VYRERCRPEVRRDRCGLQDLGDSLIQYRDMTDFFWQGKPSYGSVQGRPDLWLGRLAAESACAQYTEPNAGAETRLRVGDRLEIIPNNATLVISMQEKIYGVRRGVVERIFAVAGRDRRGATA